MASLTLEYCGQVSGRFSFAGQLPMAAEVPDQHTGGPGCQGRVTKMASMLEICLIMERASEYRQYISWFELLEQMQSKVLFLPLQL